MTTMKPTPFGYYDSSPGFQADADKVVVYVLRRHGNDSLEVELTKKQIWACFEEAVLSFNANIIEYQAKSNLETILGLPSGSFDPVTGRTNINLTDAYIQPNLEFLVRQVEAYASEVGYGQSQDSYSGSINLVDGQQHYDLSTDLVDDNGTPLLSYLSGSGRMKVFEVYHFAPINYVFNSNLASNYVATGLPVESYIPDTRFYVLPLHEDVLRANMFKTAQQVRRSNYRFRISGRTLSIYPIPQNTQSTMRNKLWVRIGFPSFFTDGTIASGAFGGSGSISVSGSSGFLPPLWGGSIVGVTAHPANMPMGLINYDSLNPWAKNWIFQYTLALCTVLLGRIRSKFKSFPIPGSELSLNGDDLVSQGREDLNNLLYGEGGLIQTLDGLTATNLALRAAERAEAQAKQLVYVPMPPRQIISIR